MTDIIERLRRRADDSDNQELDREAADEIERLRAELLRAKTIINAAVLQINTALLNEQSTREDGK